MKNQDLFNFLVKHNEESFTYEDLSNKVFGRIDLTHLVGTYISSFVKAGNIQKVKIGRSPKEGNENRIVGVYKFSITDFSLHRKKRGRKSIIQENEDFKSVYVNYIKQTNGKRIDYEKMSFDIYKTKDHVKRIQARISFMRFHGYLKKIGTGQYIVDETCKKVY